MTDPHKLNPRLYLSADEMADNLSDEDLQAELPEGWADQLEQELDENSNDDFDDDFNDGFAEDLAENSAHKWDESLTSGASAGDRRVVETLAESADSRELAFLIASAADDRKGSNIMILHTAQVSYLADYFVLITGFSPVQVRAIARSIEEKVETAMHRYPIRTEGLSEGNWVLQDYGDVIAHIFMPKERDFYNLEAFWGHAEAIQYTAQKPLPSSCRSLPLG